MAADRSPLNLVTTKEEMRGGRDAHEAAVRAIATDDAQGARAAIERDIEDAACVIVLNLRDGIGRAVKSLEAKE